MPPYPRFQSENKNKASPKRIMLTETALINTETGLALFVSTVKTRASYATNKRPSKLRAHLSLKLYMGHIIVNNPRPD